MPAPKSVVKVKAKNGDSYVEYVSSVDAAQYYLHELTRAALRDVGKYVKKTWQSLYDSHFKKRTGAGRTATIYKVIASASTTAPRVQIGLPHSHKGKEVNGFYSYFQEFGSSKTPRLGLLNKAVKDNIAEIVKIESQYLSGLSGDAEALESLIDEEEYTDDE